MPRRREPQKEETRGERIRRLRKQKGLTQVELAKAIGTSQSMVALYERRDAIPGPLILMKLSEALGVTPEQILGVDRPPRRATPPPSPENLRLWRRLRQVESLSPAERRQVLQFIQALVERRALKKRGKAS